MIQELIQLKRDIIRCIILKRQQTAKNKREIKESKINRSNANRSTYQSLINTNDSQSIYSKIRLLKSKVEKKTQNIQKSLTSIPNLNMLNKPETKTPRRSRMAEI